MQISRCTKCMNELGEGIQVCPRCGYEQGGTDQPGNALPRETILHGRYYIGNVIGQGGFGITYVSWDLTLEMKVAVKEYFPSGAAYRTNSYSNQIQWDSANNEENQWKEGVDRFLKEARKMAKLDAVPSIVRVRDAFSENQTAYIVMDFVEGDTLKDYLLEHGIMGYEECLGLLSPILDSLVVMHDNGFIHRDISPDNIMIQPDGQARLLDMGAAVDVTANGGQASRAVIKRNFSAPEQYMESEPLGSWTDVYAMGATIYYCMTGKVVPEALEREFKKTPLSFDSNPNIPLHVMEALVAALALDAQGRIRDMRELKRRLAAPEPSAADRIFTGNTAGAGDIPIPPPAVEPTRNTEEPEIGARQAAAPMAVKPNNGIGGRIVFGILVAVISFISAVLIFTLFDTPIWELLWLWMVGIAAGMCIYRSCSPDVRRADRGFYAVMAVSFLLGWLSAVAFTLLYIKLPEYKQKRENRRLGGEAVPLKLKLMVILSGIWLVIAVLCVPVRFSMEKREKAEAVVEETQTSQTAASDEIFAKKAGQTEAESETTEEAEETEEEFVAPEGWIEGDTGYFTLNDDSTYTLAASKQFEPCVTMPDTFKGKPVTAVASYAFGYRPDVEQIHISSNVKTIGEGAFEGCEDLKAVYIPSSVRTISGPLVIERSEDSPIISYFCGRAEEAVGRLNWSDGWEGTEDCQVLYGNIPADTPDYSGWILEDDEWRYYEDGFIASGWQTIAGKQYYLYYDGSAAVGWADDENDDWYYFNETDCSMTVGWAQIDGDWYYFDEDGIMLKDDYAPDGYYVDEEGIYYE